VTTPPSVTPGGPPPVSDGTKSALPTALAVLIGLAMLFIIIQGMSQVDSIKSILASAFMALNLVIVVWPIQTWLSQRVPRLIGSIVAGGTALAILAGLMWALGWAITKLVTELPNYRNQFTDFVNAIVDFAGRQGVDTNKVYEQAVNQLSTISITTIVTPLNSLASNVSGAVYLVFLIVMILIFMLMDSTTFGARMSRLGERHNPTLAWALMSFARGTRRYWVVASIFGLIVALFDWVLLLALGVPLASVWALFAFVTNYIPNIGFVLGVIPPVIMGFLDGSWQTALWVAVGYSVLNVVIQGFIQPRVSGGAVGITPTVAVLSLLIWATVLGPLGALLAIPATLLVKTLFIDMDPQLRWLNTIIAADMVTSEADPINLTGLLERAKQFSKFPSRSGGHSGATQVDDPAAATDPESAPGPGQPIDAASAPHPDQPIDPPTAVDPAPPSVAQGDESH
jgi:predicted PurR-regulated permease PerM